MRRPFLIIGVLATTAFLVPLPAAAQAAKLCDGLRGATALSPYVQKVLERADAGLSFAQQGNDDGGDIELYWYSLVENAGATVLQGMDTERRITGAIQDLIDRSACLRYDALLISCKIEEVRKALNTATSKGIGAPSAEKSFKLQELLLFLFNRDRYLSAGALDPWYADPDWGRVYAFDAPTPGFCCRSGDNGLACETSDFLECNPGTFWKTADDCAYECEVAEFPDQDPRLCPYDSDYAMPTEGGYGCDETVMPSVGLLADEKDSLTKLRAAVEKLRSDAFGSSSSAASRPPALVGCASTFGHCSDGTNRACQTSGDCETGASCVFQKGTCLNEPSVQCREDRDCPDVPTGTTEDGETAQASICVLPPVSPPATVIRRGPFSLIPDQLRLVEAFIQWNRRVGASRPFRSDLAAEREGGQADDEFVDPFQFLTDQNDRSIARQAGADEGTLQGRLMPLSDASDQLQAMLKPLREAIADFSELAAGADGVRKFVRAFSSYLLRNCLDDPCQTDLERVWTIANTDECFPYADGSYLEDDCTEASQSRAQKCADAAGIMVQVPACSSSSAATNGT